ncbi:HNH endonuclease [Klebsiella pneumoniae]|nr:HNH endonuclease [Klebsiella pneumoniae]
MMRYGTYELTKRGKRKDRTKNSKGYQMINFPDHPLVMANGFVYEHRKVIYDRYGDTLPPCEICGKEVTWKTAHIDHIDEVVDNNSDSNLRVLCRACNVMRSRVHIPEHTKNLVWQLPSMAKRKPLPNGPETPGFDISYCHQASAEKWYER